MQELKKSENIQNVVMNIEDSNNDKIRKKFIESDKHRF